MGTSEMQLFIEAFFDALDIEFNIGIYYFSLLDVFFGGVLFSVIGFAISKIFLFFTNKR